MQHTGACSCYVRLIGEVQQQPVTLLLDNRAAVIRWVKREGSDGLAGLSGSLTSAPPESAPAAPDSRALALSGAFH